MLSSARNHAHFARRIIPLRFGCTRAANHPLQRSTSDVSLRQIRTTATSPKSALPLSHIRVLDLSRILAGPYATQLMGDMGAEVIKIEKPGEGDDTRRFGPPFSKETGLSAYYICANRNKKSVAVDLRTSEGQKIIKELSRQSDVFIENYGVGNLAKYGLDYESIRNENPAIIYCSITGFGQSGPYSSRPGYDYIVQAMSGLMSITGERDGSALKVGVAITDIMTGMYAANAILAAVIQRDRAAAESGQPPKGQRIDVSLLDSNLAFLANQAASYLVAGVVPNRMGNSHPSIAPYDAIDAADGPIVVAVGNDKQFADFARIIGAPELITDSRFTTNAARVQNRRDLLALIEEKLKTQPKQHWIKALNDAKVPCGPINTIKEIFEDEHVQTRGMVWPVTYPPTAKHNEATTVNVVANPIRYSDTPLENKQQVPPPLLGQDTTSVLKELLSVDEDQLRLWETQRVIQSFDDTK